ncbi:mercuric ion transport protein [Lentzea albidocapillata subsp. violacea]|uniref:Mercuric ion transport protein n=1 Tax=Lentzea albidocapillata subsp. violacea TaxID=128104 RepID=A0A1G9YBW9_9PSEU|nr:hypothetical protein [Lentzea albidocapillata]SDN06559.1 mercuric ion transport protein [Lentzea albidocapillata subsp. violacea]
MSTPATPGPDSVVLPVHVTQHEQSGPPKRSKVVAFLAAIACVGCCALPLLVPLGLLGGAGVAAATTGLLVVSTVLFGLAGLLWLLHHRQKSNHSCPQGNCSC